MTFRTFVIRLMILTGLLALVTALCNHYIPFISAFAAFNWYALIFFFLLTLLTAFIGFRAITKTPHAFVAGVNGIVVLKLFLSVAFIIAFKVIAKPERNNFISTFFLLYILFTVFEIRSLVIAQKKAAHKQQT